MKGNPAAPGDQLTSKPTWSNTLGCSTTSAFFFAFGRALGAQVSNKSGTSSQVISLPKGGGALHGIGEKFSPDLHTGTGNFSVPIALPPGRNAFQPQLNLVYSTGQGNGFFGQGWSLGIPGVSRRTAKGVPRYDENDVFILSGA